MNPDKRELLQNGEKVASMIYVWMAGTRTYWQGEGNSSQRVTEPTGDHPEHVVSMAESDPAAWEAARMLCAGKLEHREDLPEPLRRFCTEHLRGKWPKPNPPGPGKTHLLRDLHIANDVYMNMRDGLNKSNAYYVVGKKYKFSDGAVRKIWERLGAHVKATREHGPYYFLESGLKIEPMRMKE